MQVPPCDPQWLLVTDEIIRSLGVRATGSELFEMAAEMERRIHIHPSGPVMEVRIVAELRRLAVALRNGLPCERVHG